METLTTSTIFFRNETFTTESAVTTNSIDGNAIRIIQSTVASVGIIANLTVNVVFLNHKKMRRKIPNIFIINQVRVVIMYTYIQEKAIYIYLMAMTEIFCQ